MPQLVPRSNVPAIQPPPGPTALRTIVWGIGPQYSYETNMFKFTDSMDLVLSNEAVQLSQWITNALITPRLRQYIHGIYFGSDFDGIFTKNYPQSVIKNLADKFVRRALLGDDRIKSITQIVTTIVPPKALVVDVTLITQEGFQEQFRVQWSVP